MAIAKLIPSSYSLSDASLSIVNVKDMYTDTDSDTFAIVTNQSNSTASCYLYLDGFDFSMIPDDAIVSSYTVKLKAKGSGISTSSSYAPRLVGVDSTCLPLSSNVHVLTFNCYNDWETINRRDFKIEINCRKSSKNNTGFLYVYGAEIEVEYTTPLYSTITTSVIGQGSVYPNGIHRVYNGNADSLVITPGRAEAKVSATKNGIDVQDRLIPHGKKYTLSAVLGKCTVTSGGFNTPDATYFTGIIGHGINATRTISNYRSNDSHTVFEYDMSFDSIPSNVTIERVYCEVNGHAENTSSSCMSVQLKSGSTYLSEKVDFKITGSNNVVVTLQATPTISQLENLALECDVGSYGGAINGATCYVEYSINEGKPNYYTYTYIPDGDTNIVVTIKPVIDNKISFKSNGVWIEATDVYKKVNGSWIKCDDVTAVFDSNMNYISGNV